MGAGENWLLQAGLGLLDSQVQESTDSLAATEGRELPFAADTSASLLVIKDIALGNSTLSLQARRAIQVGGKNLRDRA